jgi:Na+-driven multidrug efflux pump
LGGLYLFEGLRSLTAAALQGMKDFKSPLKASYWMNGLHIVLAILAIYLLDLGLVGVAWATMICQMVGLLYLLLPLYQQAFPDREG